jgi:hypothetical protein
VAAGVFIAGVVPGDAAARAADGDTAIVGAVPTAGAAAAADTAWGRIPPGGVGLTAIVGATAAGAGRGAATTAAGVPSFCPQCWQKANPCGVCFPQLPQLTFGADAGTVGTGAATTATATAGTATGVGCSDESWGEMLVPHILQKPIPTGFTAPHAGQVGPSRPTLGDDAVRFRGGASSNFCPQSWQKSDPSLFAFPQFAQRGIADPPSGIQLREDNLRRRRRLFTRPRTYAKKEPLLRFWQMKIPTSSVLYKPCATALLALCMGCAATAAEATFTARPDTVQPGDLRGPFDGQVLDAENGKPIEGASVLASWAFEVGSGLSGPAAATSKLVETDSDGRYTVPQLEDLGDNRMRLARFTLVIYKRGYIAFRSDRRFEDFSVRHDFAQSGQVAKLEKLTGETSHVRHVRFIGAGGPLLAKLGWELQQASLESAGEKPAAKPETTEQPEKPEATLDATLLLTADELKAVTGYKGDFTVEKLGDLQSTGSYDSVHFRATGQPEKFDAAIRVWKIAPDDAEKLYERDLKELPGAVEKNEIGDRSLRAGENGTFGLTALDKRAGIVVRFTCGSAQCADADTAAAILKRMWTRLPKLARVEEPEDKGFQLKMNEHPKLPRGTP